MSSSTHDRVSLARRGFIRLAGAAGLAAGTGGSAAAQPDPAPVHHTEPVTGEMTTADILVQAAMIDVQVDADEPALNRKRSASSRRATFLSSVEELQP